MEQQIGDTSLDHSVLFTGAVPADSVEDVFRLLAKTVGSRAMAYPDGELNERQYWIGALRETVWERCADVERIPSRIPEGSPLRNMFPSYRVKDGVSAVRIDGLLPYARAAIESYEHFKRLRAEGVIDPSVLFQVAMPAALDAIALYFPRVADWPVVIRAWTEALHGEHRRILDVIPPEDLTVQLDYCLEVAITSGVVTDTDWMRPEMTGLDAFARYTSHQYLASHWAALPEEVSVGYHICLGTFPSWPRVTLSDASLPVALANALAANSGRRIDFFHLPIVSHSEESYFAPLERLDAGSAAIYLGIECNNGVAAMRRRISHARKFLDRFGVAHYCGYGFNADNLHQLLADLRDGADDVG